MNDQKVRIGVLSQAHMHSHSYLSALTSDPRVELVGLWDDDVSAGLHVATVAGTRFFDTEAELLGLSLDGVIVTSENIHHRRLTELAANAGVKAILCEKPLATTVADARAMVETCAQAGVQLATAFPCRFHPTFDRLKAAVTGGAVGKVLAIRATNHGKCPFGWFVEKEKSGGGAIIDHTVHVADLNRALLGVEATEVYAESGTNMYHQDWEDCGLLTITYATGVFSTLDTSWSRPRHSFRTWGDVTMEIVGTEGVASIDMFGQSALLSSEETRGNSELGWGSNADAGMVDEFLTLAAGGTSTKIATGYDGLKALEVALGAYESVRTRQVVRL